MISQKEMQEFISMVRDMRTAQKEFFRTRDQGYLTQSKRLEKDVDKAIEKLTEKPSAKQLGFWGV